MRAEKVIIEHKKVQFMVGDGAKGRELSCLSVCSSSVLVVCFCRPETRPDPHIDHQVSKKLSKKGYELMLFMSCGYCLNRGKLPRSDQNQERSPGRGTPQWQKNEA